MKPKKSLLKFRLPYPSSVIGKNDFEYFKGEILFQSNLNNLGYCSPTSTETRLIPQDDLAIINYSPIIYEE